MPIADRLARPTAALLAMLMVPAVLTACAVLLAATMSPVTGRPRPVPAQTAAPAVAAPKPAAVRPERAWATETLAAMTLEQKVGQLFIAFPYGTTATTADANNRKLYGVDTAAEVVSRYHVGGVIYFEWSNGLRSPKQVAKLSNGLQSAALTSGAGLPLIVCTDQENGTVNRIGPPFTRLPGGSQLGRSGSPEDARAAASVAGTELRAMGINTDLAPVADVNVNPQNPVIGPRSFSADPAVAATLTGAQVTGYQESVAATAKHFPGHGDTAVDSHTGLPVITHDREEWSRLDAPPFRSAIAAGVDVIMTGHLVLPKLDRTGDPATLSPEIITGLLRTELNFRGVIMTDSLRMRGVRAKHADDRIPVLALKAGVDVLLMPPNLDLAYNSVLAAVRSGELSEWRIDQSVRRILELKFRRGMVDRPLTDEAAVDTIVGSPAHREIAARLTSNADRAGR